MPQSRPEVSAVSKVFGVRELVDHIASLVDETVDLAALALVNRDFCEAARRKLYTSIDTPYGKCC